MDKDLKPSERGKRVSVESQIVTEPVILRLLWGPALSLISDVLMPLRLDVLNASVVCDVDICVVGWITAEGYLW